MSHVPALGRLIAIIMISIVSFSVVVVSAESSITLDSEQPLGSAVSTTKPLKNNVNYLSNYNINSNLSLFTRSSNGTTRGV